MYTKATYRRHNLPMAVVFIAICLGGEFLLIHSTAAKIIAMALTFMMAVVSYIVAMADLENAYCYARTVIELWRKYGTLKCHVRWAAKSDLAIIVIALLVSSGNASVYWHGVFFTLLACPAVILLVGYYSVRSQVMLLP